MDRSGRSIVAYFVYGGILMIITGIVWYVGSRVLWTEGSSIGWFSENVMPEGFTGLLDPIKWFWQVFPIVIIIGIVVYLVLASQKREPLEGQYPTRSIKLTRLISEEETTNQRGRAGSGGDYAF
ncbi:hypothetical protein AKJ45_03220 [candidate division MSBL1 archaeon SCGC-AAA261F19]|uniref:Uncharacterized protein n=1 Tax=candidate division MSBL1 archaeon SCGC-AAA261F19 TaxID=1698275 RepID=A0A133V8Q1_9EURY|nr:hypothetical protein AKJ45_03220 [candidate division MSBL1 archaeon SCGC-AAA261F19]